MARTDARAVAGMNEAMRRMEAFHNLGADILFLEAPRSTSEMQQFCDGVGGITCVSITIPRPGAKYLTGDHRFSKQSYLYTEQ
jgi:2-methylisocitrate lyase-like PEP mutase family enzyme